VKRLRIDLGADPTGGKAAEEVKKKKEEEHKKNELLEGFGDELEGARSGNK
jgi:hypothetical protein